MRKALITALCILSFAACSAASLAANEYRIIDLGVGARAWRINNRNQVVGTMKKGDSYSAFIWDSANGMRDLGTLGGDYSQAVAINDAGQVLGWTHTGTGEKCEFIWDQTNGMQRWEHPGIPTPNKLLGINNSGQIAAVTVDLGAFVWDRGVVAYAAGPAYFGGTAFNNNSQITGYCFADDNTRSFFLDSTNGAQWIPQSTTRSNQAEDINDSGQVVGTVFGFADPEIIWDTCGFIWDRENGMTIISAEDHADTSANGINNRGDVVGSYTAKNGRLGHAYVWNRESGMFVLPTLGNLNAGGGRINDNGWIIGYIQDRSVIWQPVPEPTSIVVLGMGLAGMFCSRKRRISSEIFGRKKT